MGTWAKLMWNSIICMRGCVRIFGWLFFANESHKKIALGTHRHRKTILACTCACSSINHSSGMSVYALNRCEPTARWMNSNKWKSIIHNPSITLQSARTLLLFPIVDCSSATCRYTRTEWNDSRIERMAYNLDQLLCIEHTTLMAFYKIPFQSNWIIYCLEKFLNSSTMCKIDRIAACSKAFTRFAALDILFWPNME